MSLGHMVAAATWLRSTAAAHLCRRGFATAAGPQRDERFATLTPDDVTIFRTMLGEQGVETDPSALDAHNRDWMHKYQGNSSLVLRPGTTEQVAAALRHCNQRRLAVVPQGGNTGLVGGSVPVFDEVVLHTGRLNRILNFDPASGVLVAQAGCVLGALDKHVWEHGWIMPLDLGAKGSCHIGGNVSTNAGGLRLLRYGSLHGSVLGVEVVTAQGEVLDLLKTLRKDNTGYDLKHLFIGAEGTLGIVTAVAIQCAPRPASVQVVLFAVESFGAVVRLLRAARHRLGEVLSAFEFLDATCMTMVTGHLPGVTNPLGGAAQPSPFYVVMETHGSNEEHDTAKLQAFLEEAMGDPELGISDGAVAASETQAAAIWAVREGVAEALGRRGAVYKYDVSLPVTGMYQLVEDVKERLASWAPDVHVVGYGHVGDGNLHLNIAAPSYTPELEAAIEPYVYERVAAQQGSVSAEHGLGRMKAECIGYSKPAAAVALMAEIKALLDPRGILNPYKVLPQSAITGATTMDAGSGSQKLRCALLPCGCHAE